MNPTTLLLVLLAGTDPVPSTAQAPVRRGADAAAWSEFVPIPGVRELGGRLIVRPRQLRALLDEGVELAEAWALRAAAREQLEPFEILRYVPATDEYIVRLNTAGSEESVATALMSSGNFQYVEPDWLVAPTGLATAAQSGPIRVGPGQPGTPQAKGNSPDDPSFQQQWHHQAGRMNSALAWSLATDAPNVSIGICDSGVNTSHEDLQLNRLEGYNAVDRLWESQGGDIGPVFHHGTRAVGTVAANGDNGIGVVGVGWDLAYRVLRVTNRTDGVAFVSDLLHGARTSVESGDRVVNVSYEGSASSANLTTATYVKSLGGLLVWSAGNTGATLDFGDRDADDLVVVGATNEFDGLAYFSNRGRFVDVVAPGFGILTTDADADDAYVYAQGTSFAAPLAAGVCAMIWGRRPNLSPNDVELLLKASCKDLGAVGVDDQFGHGRADLFAAVTEDGSAIPQADFVAGAVTGASPLVVDFRDLSTGVPTSWTWDFGDGATSSEQNPSHTYTTSGIFTVALTARNSLGMDTRTRTAFVIVDLVPPVAEFVATPEGGLSPFTTDFTDQSTGGAPTAWTWTFGDGTTSNQANPTHVYANPGFYTVQLTVSNAYGSSNRTKTNYIAVDFVAPVAAFSAQPTTGSAPLPVSFTDESGGGTATTWSWTFGDGESSTTQNPTHTYTTPGTYSVQLTASNSFGSDTLVRTDHVVVD